MTKRSLLSGPGHTMFNALTLFNALPGYTELLAAPAVASLLLTHAPNAPRRLRRRLGDEPRSDRPTGVEGPVL